MIGRRRFMAGMAVGAVGLSACREAAQATQASPAATQSPTTGQPARGRVLTRTELEDAIKGSSYLGCGGGGKLSTARELIAEDLAAGLEFRLLPVSELADDDRVGCPYGLGSTAPITEEMEAKLEASPNRIEAVSQAAFQHLEEQLGTAFAGVIMGEIGPLSLAEGLSTAARLGRAALDADTVGRAVPEINQHSVKVAGVSLVPASAATQFGDKLVLHEVGDPTRAEDVFRAISVASRVIGVTDSPLTGAIAKRPGVLVQDSVSLAMRIGAAARTGGIDAARDAGEGWTLFEGVVRDWEWGDADGFLVGKVYLDGADGFAGQTMELDYKNEFLVARRDGEVVATCPDLITLIDQATADGINAPDFARGQAVTVLGYKSDPIWRTEAGLDVFSPRYFGYDIDYIPIEDRIG